MFFKKLLKKFIFRPTLSVLLAFLDSPFGFLGLPNLFQDRKTLKEMCLVTFEIWVWGACLFSVAYATKMFVYFLTPPLIPFYQAPQWNFVNISVIIFMFYGGKKLKDIVWGRVLKL